MLRILKTRCVLLLIGAALCGWACTSANRQAADAPTAQAPDTASSQQPGNIWKSETTGKQYRVTIKGNELRADWVNLPPAAAEHGAYIRTVCHKQGAKWIGSAEVFMPCTIGSGKQEHIANTCHLTLKMEIDSVTPSRITGHGQSVEKFDCDACKVVKAGWASFVWVPAR